MGYRASLGLGFEIFLVEMGFIEIEERWRRLGLESMLGDMVDVDDILGRWHG